MSTPPFIDLPVGVVATSFSGPVGNIAALTCGSGHDVLLVPGFTGSKEDFLPLLPLLAGSGYRATAIDLRGQYQSAPADPPNYGLADFAQEVAAVAADLTKPHLIGHSFGGLVCREYVLESADSCATLTLMDSGPAAIGDTPLLQALIAAIPVIDMQTIWDVKQAQDLANDVPQPPQPVVAFLHKRWLENDPQSVLAMATILRDTPDRTAELTQLPLPKLVMYGEDDYDTWPPGVQQEMAQRLGVDAVAIPQAAHSPAIENPPATLAALEFFWQSNVSV